MEGESGEIIFLRYAHPVIGYCNDVKVDSEELAYYTRILRDGREEISQKRMGELFPDAVGCLRSWEEEDVRNYWLRVHNEVPEVATNPLCQVYLRRVEEVLLAKGDEVCKIRVGGMGEVTPKSYIHLDKGDDVTLHAFQVAEKLSPALFSKYSLGLI